MQINIFMRFFKKIETIFIHEGNLRPLFRAFFVIVGGGVVFLDLDLWQTGWLYIVGFVVGGVGGYAARAHQLGIRPFEPSPYPRGWLSRRKRDDEEEKCESDGSK